MMPNFKRVIIVCALLAAGWLVPEVQLTAASGPQGEGDRPLQVVIKEVEPFVIKDGGRLTGFSIDVWQDLANRIGQPYEYVMVASVGEQLEAVEQGEADIAIAAISMTAERERSIDFSHGYYLSGLQIMMAPGGGLDPLERILNIVPGLLPLAGLLLLVIVAFAHLVWLSERKVNARFSKGYWRGIEDGIWYSVATLTTVGYGDITPKSRFGRALGIFWMFVGIFLIASFAASVASQFTVDRLAPTVKAVEDLEYEEVATIQGTTSDDFLTAHRIRHTGVTDLDTA
ncbi:MAG: transporter substrate-binding domain-containing protein, partial [Gammaproteobacteria bacterium]|nr:transporter substrate-binding domain-containing protein [Gammaproteobacteria bacterium]